MGTLSIDENGLARIVFTDYVETHSSIQGWFSLEGNFKDAVFEEGDPVEITVEFAGTTVIITFEEDEDTFSVSADKHGSYDPDTNRITWTVTVTPNEEATLTVVDTFSNNQTFVSGSFAVDGTPVADGDLTITPEASTTEISYETAMNRGRPRSPIRPSPPPMRLKRRRGSNENVVFSNGVDVYRDDKPYADDDATVTINWIRKTGGVVGTSYDDSRIIRWNVTVNGNGYDINGCTITDTIPADLEFYVDATHPIQFAGTDLINNTSGDPNTYTCVADGDTHILTVYLGNLTASGTLVFYTRVDNEDLYTGNGTTLFTNSGGVLAGRRTCPVRLRTPMAYVSDRACCPKQRAAR